VLWAVLFSIVATMILQEMTARLGHYTNSIKANIAGGLVALICTGLGLYSLLDAIRSFTGT